MQYNAVICTALSPCAGGVPFLITREKEYAWWQLALLDVYLLLGLAVTAVLGVLLGFRYLVMKRLLRFARGKTRLDGTAQQLLLSKAKCPALLKLMLKFI